MRPECNRDLFVFFEDGNITSVEELAHVIAHSDNGPRSEVTLDASARDEYENLLVLCPSCHSEIDKAPKQFPLDLLLKWKTSHEASIARCFDAPSVKNRRELSQLLDSLLAENKALFEAYGPFSKHQNYPLTDAKAAWDRAIRENIIPNNRRITELLLKNRQFLTKEEEAIFEKFRLHKNGLEYNHLSGDKNNAAQLFPKGMNTILKD